MTSLADTLIQTWAKQGREGFLLADNSEHLETKLADDPQCGAQFRFRWLPHREVRSDVAELERRGILNPNRDETGLFRDPRDPRGQFCFLCEGNIRECNPLERLVPVTLAGREYLAGANFAWIEPNHFTIMSREHTDQLPRGRAVSRAVQRRRGRRHHTVASALPSHDGRVPRRVAGESCGVSDCGAPVRAVGRTGSGFGRSRMDCP